MNKRFGNVSMRIKMVQYVVNHFNPESPLKQARNVSNSWML